MSVAYVNHGRWVAGCDTPSCTGAERFWPGGRPRQTRQAVTYGITGNGVLHCANCGQTSTVEFPSDKTAINRVLARRPVPETRNWYPGESPESLVEENAAYGLDSS